MELAPIQLPIPVPSVGPGPHQAAQPPNSYDVCIADGHEHQAVSGRANNEQLASAIKYKAAIVARSDADIAPPWFHHALQNALQPLRNEIAEIKTRTQHIEAQNQRIEAQTQQIKTQLGATQRLASILYNRTLGIGSDAPFEQVPYPNGTLPWGLRPGPPNRALPRLTSAAVVLGLDAYYSLRYYEGYYPEVENHDGLDRVQRNRAILRAIGCIDHGYLATEG